MRLDQNNLRDIANSPDSPEGSRRITAAVCAAMNDWPTSDLFFVDDFLRELSDELGQLTYKGVHSGRDRMNLATKSWKSESLSELLAAWTEDNRHLTLDELLGCISYPSVNDSLNLGVKAPVNSSTLEHIK